MYNAHMYKWVLWSDISARWLDVGEDVATTETHTFRDVRRAAISTKKGEAWVNEKSMSNVTTVRHYLYNRSLYQEMGAEWSVGEMDCAAVPMNSAQLT